MEEITDKMLEMMSKVDGIMVEEPDFNQDDSQEENLDASNESDKPL